MVFPKSYEKYRELLVDDALLRIGAKVDKSRRDESLQLLLETAEALDLSARLAPAAELPPQMDIEGQAEDILSSAGDSLLLAPTEDAPHPADAANDRPDRRAETMEPQRTHTDEAKRDGGAGAALPGEQQVSIIRSRVKIGSNGNGHGNGNGNGNGSAAAAPAPVAAHSLRLYLPRTNDFDADIDLMHRVDRVLRQNSGEDQVIIHMPNAAGTVVLQPRHKVRCSDDLIGALRSVLGSESVLVDG